MRGVIEHPESCPSCDYSREGLDPHGRCPECGLRIFPDSPVFHNPPTRRTARILVVFHVLAGTFYLVLALARPMISFSLDLLLALGWYTGAAVWAWRASGPQRFWVLSPDGLLRVQGGRIIKCIPWEEVGGLTRPFYMHTSVAMSPPSAHDGRRHWATFCSGPAAVAFMQAVERVKAEIHSGISSSAR